jgi:glycosyltransferase involved in cell wall biosynthesis
MTADGRRRIAFVSGAGYFGGAEKYIELLASGLDRERYEPVLVTSGSRGLEPLRSALAGEGIPVEITEGNSFSSADGVRSLFRLIQRLRPDIVHMNMPGPFDCSYGLPASLARLAGVQRIVTTDHLPMVGSFTKAKVIRTIHMRNISRFITVSEDNRSHMVDIHGVSSAKIRVVYNGIPDPGPVGTTAGGTADSPDAPVNLLVAGALEERKGQMLALSAMEKLPGSFHLSIAGDGPLRSKLEAELAAGRFGDRVDLLGRVDDMAGLVARSDVLLVPSLMEATPYVILEAMAAGRPVVASKIYGIPEQVEDDVTGILVPPGDPDAIAAALIRFSKEPGLLKRMGDAGRKRYEDRFTLERSVAGTMSVYDELF